MLGMDAGAAALVLTLTLLVVLGGACEAAGGVLYNPANSAMLFALGKGSTSEHLVRSVAQSAGGVAGALLAQTLLPAHWAKGFSGMALGLRSGVGLLDGAACEFVLGLLLAFAVLWSGQLQSSALKIVLPLAATVVAVIAGAHLTGPSLNPAFTFAWNFLYPSQRLAESLLVFWVAPLASGLFGGWAFLGWQQWSAERSGSAQQQRAKAE